MSRLPALVAALLLIAAPAHADLGKPRTFGKQAVRVQIEPVTKAIYEGAKDWVYSLRKTERPDGSGIFATEAQGGYVDGRLSRIIATDWNSYGKYQSEYYFQGGVLVFTYETFEWFEGKEPRAAARDSRGLAAWERRSYFKEGAIAYAEATGTGGPMAGTDGDKLVARAGELSALIEARRAAGSAK